MAKPQDLNVDESCSDNEPVVRIVKIISKYGFCLELCSLQVGALCVVFLVNDFLVPIINKLGIKIKTESSQDNICQITDTKMATITITQGKLRGAKRSTESGFEYFEFLSIPYAKPPIGDLRFKSPQLPDSWENERDATKIDKNNISCQLLPGTGKFIGSEDCLYLNVFTPKLDNSRDLLPVIFYIHGGGFVSGNGILKSDNGPDFLLENNTVVVTMNYRLGVFGFLALDIPEASGNMGLKDQVMALKWVRDNISKFGGDSNNVTVLGSSAGSASVEYLMLSPLSKGLFHKGIMQSGSVLNHWVRNRNAAELTKQLLKTLNYKGSTNDNRAIYEFLSTLSAKTITQAVGQAVLSLGTEGLFFGYVPTIEKDFGDSQSFLTQDPYKSLRDGNFYKVPVIKSFCNREGILMALLGHRAIKSTAKDKNFTKFWFKTIDVEKKNAYNTKFAHAYLNNAGKDEEDIVEDFFGDLDFVSGILLTAKLISKHVPVYVYEFNYEGKINYCKNLFSMHTEGTLHVDDLSYVWRVDRIKDASAQDIIVRNRLVKLLTDFAKNGKPVAETNELIPVTWPAFNEDSQLYLSIDAELSHKSKYQPEKMAVFEELFSE